ncbi:outer membrane protein, OmpA/MotB family [hydrothermal vent metagenome]|uniref:Outer membrane protein, OmpA/MotB family n=1 Tax=hydrothermal vent metagenome TaxID=652676 RepID=A0A1W1BI51_9ZZZZ
MKKSSKILIYGLLLSVLLIASCLYMKKLEFDKPKELMEKKEVSIQSVLEKNDSKSKSDNRLVEQSTLDYKIEKDVIFIAGKMPLLEDTDPLKKSMMRMCGVIYCDRTILFSSDIQTPTWKNFAKEVIDLFYKENLSYASFFVDKSSKITIGGEFLREASKNKLSNLLKKYTQYNITDNTNLKVLKIIEKKSVVESNNSNMNIIEKNSTKSRDEIDIAQEEITELLKSKKINFVRNRARITPKGIETLNEVIAILKKVPDAKIEVRGYTDASGKRSINRWISTERAKSVRNYLGSSGGINPVNIEVKGFGEEGLLYKDQPYSKLNRRVEIGIRRR